MADDLVKMGDQFSGLDMSSLIGGPLKAACDAQTMLASATANFIENVGMETDKDSKKKTIRTTKFSFTRTTVDEKSGAPKTEEVEMNVPLLSIINIPALQVDNVDVKFDMEVKSAVSSESKSAKEGQIDAEAGLAVGPFHMDVKIKGSVSSQESNTRSSDNSAKYHVEVHAAQAKEPEGLARMMDVLATACTPTVVQKDETSGTEPSETDSPGDNPSETEPQEGNQ